MSDFEMEMFILVSSFFSASFIVLLGVGYLRDERKGSKDGRIMAFVCFLFCALFPVGGAVYLVRSLFWTVYPQTQSGYHGASEVMRAWPLVGFLLGISTIGGLALCCFFKPSLLAGGNEVQAATEKHRLKKLGFEFIVLIVLQILLWLWISN